MPRYKLVIEYDGGAFAGWQRQEDGIVTVQQVIEDAFAKFTETPRMHASGRTDAGVHARGQVAHVTLERTWHPNKLQGALNWYMRPHPVSILSVEEMPIDWHARFSCIGRRYVYRILNRRGLPALEIGRVWFQPSKLDAAAMHEAAQRLIGHHDFSTFRAAQCQANSAMRTLEHLSVERLGDEIHVHASARSFLHHQVRNMVGTLAMVGFGKWSADDVTRALEAKDRAAGGPTAPPDGLYFMEAFY
ncbi:tRNA pseudouridine(38-40) synthase TruA [Lacibacterium aquatile]|uniref:tRNA pseudouridine synthase A n=1 Tax=Lacibacterium aquatile TaxID=1168082 RepID=A0ABW5DP79_9PROT